MKRCLVQKPYKMIHIFSFMNILLKQLGIRSKLNRPYYKIIWITLDEFRSSGHSDLTRNTSDKSVDPEEENFIFLHTRDSVAWKSTCNWNLCVEYLLDHNCLQVHPTFSTRRGRPWRWETVWRTENSHGADEACYTACGPHNSETKICNLLRGTIETIHEEFGMINMC